MKTGVEHIAEERREQIEKHGWAPVHDADHKYGELSKNAACLACLGTDAKVIDPAGCGTDDDVWQLIEHIGRDRIHALKVAGALIAAEIDRLQNI